MIKVFCNKRGSGKSKELINLANECINELKGNAVFIDNDAKRMLSVNSRIRFVSMKDYPISSYCEFTGFICGILSNDYDIENIYIDNLQKIFNHKIDVKTLNLYLDDLNKLSEKYDVNVFINIHEEGEVLSEDLKEFIA